MMVGSGPLVSWESMWFVEEKWASYGEPYVFKKREDPVVVVLNETDILSGDYLAIRHWDGIDDIIRLGTGGMTGHTAVMLWFGDELYVCESVGKNAAWPAPYGIIKTPYQRWIEMSVNASNEIAILRLNDEALANFDEEAAVAWFNTVEGLPYGYHNFLFGWLDTPTGNYPPPLEPTNGAVFLSLFAELDPAGADRLYGQALNHRLNTTDLTYKQIIEEADKRNISIWDLISVPEQDDWIYSDGKSMVCDVMVLGVYKAGGIFGDLTDQISVTEFTPKDSYQLDIFNKNWAMPAACIDDLPYCQIMGTYLMELPGFSAIPMYADMNLHCPGYLPDFDNSTRTMC